MGLIDTFLERLLDMFCSMSLFTYTSPLLLYAAVHLLAEPSFFLKICLDLLHLDLHVMVIDKLSRLQVNSVKC